MAYCNERGELNFYMIGNVVCYTGTGFNSHFIDCAGQGTDPLKIAEDIARSFGEVKALRIHSGPIKGQGKANYANGRDVIKHLRHKGFSVKNFLEGVLSSQ